MEKWYDFKASELQSRESARTDNLGTNKAPNF